MSINFQEILKELEYRVEHGIIDLNKEEQVTKLVQILRENGISDANKMAQKARVYYSYLNEANQSLDKILKQKFTNPETGNQVTVASALGYKKSSKAYTTAKSMMGTAGYSEKDIDMVDAGPDDEEKPTKKINKPQPQQKAPQGTKLGGSDYKLDIEKEKEKPTQQSKKSNTKSLKRSESETKRQKLNDASIVNIVKNGLIPTQVRANSGAGLYAPTEKQLKSSLDFFQKRMQNPDYQLDYPKYDVSEQDIDRVQEVMINEMGKKEYSRVMGLIQKAGGVDPKLTTGEAGKQRARDIIRLYLSHGGRSAVTGEVVPFNQMQLDHRIAYSNAIKNVAEKKKKGIKTTLLEEQDRLDSPENWDLMESSINQMKNSLEPSALVNRINQKLSQSPEEKELKKLEQEVKNLREAKLLQNLVSSFSKGDYGGMNQQNIENMSADEIDVVMKAWNYWHPNTRDAIIFRRIDPNYDKKLKAKGIQIPPPDHSNTIVRGQAQKGSHRSRGEKRPVADRKRVTIEAMKKEKVLQSKKVTNITDMVLLKAIKNVDKSLKTQTSRIGTLKQTVKQQKSKKK